MKDPDALYKLGFNSYNVPIRLAQSCAFPLCGTGAPAAPMIEAEPTMHSIPQVGESPGNGNGDRI